MQHHDEIIKKVKEELQNKAKEIKGADIFVSVENDAVILKGVVDSKKEAEKAVQIAKSVSGVKTVKEEFRILSEQKQPGDMGTSAHPGYSITNDDQGCSPSPRVG